MCELSRHSVGFFSIGIGQGFIFRAGTPFTAGLNDACHPLGTLFAPSFATFLVGRGHKRQLKAERCSVDRQKPFQAARVRWSHRQRPFPCALSSVTKSCCGRLCLDATLVRRWERVFAREAKVFLRTERSCENGLIVL